MSDRSASGSRDPVPVSATQAGHSPLLHWETMCCLLTELPKLRISGSWRQPPSHLPEPRPEESGSVTPAPPLARSRARGGAGAVAPSGAGGQGDPEGESGSSSMPESRGGLGGGLCLPHLTRAPRAEPRLRHRTARPAGRPGWFTSTATVATAGSWLPQRGGPCPTSSSSMLLCSGLQRLFCSLLWEGRPGPSRLTLLPAQRWGHQPRLGSQPSAP